MLPRMLPQAVRSLASGTFFPSLCLGLAFSLICTITRADVVSLKVSNKIMATADYKPGAKDRPVILILHGFLQTREFAIIKSMTDELANAGYAVLSPSLSLGITNRNKSLDCEALHLHDMAGDIDEIQHWVKWLRGKGYKKIVGLGHSFGGTHLLAWAEKYPHEDFRLIAISLVGSMPQIQSNKPAPDSVRKPGNALLKAPLSFCNSYTSPARNYFSYVDWDELRIMSALKSSKIPVDAIMGSADTRLVPGWVVQLNRAGFKTHMIKNANHFMDGTHEFDVLDITLNLLKS